MKDFLILGLGFSGISFSWELEKRNLSYLVADPLTNSSSTFISGGLINPVSGRKYNNQWNIDALTKKIKQEYSLLERKFGVELLKEVQILKIHKSEAALEEWQLKRNNQELKKYINENPLPVHLGKFLDYRFGYIIIQNALIADTKKLITHYSNFLIMEKKLVQTFIQPDEIIIHEDCIEWKDQKFKYLVCCEGISAISGKLFNNIPFKPSKGESLIIHVPHFNSGMVIQKGIIMIPLGNHDYWIGATNTWDDLSPEPTGEARKELAAGIEQLLKVDYEIISQHAAVRPSIRDRSPVVGRHPDFKNVFVLNGMGTKGASLSNFYAEQLAGHILNDGKINKEAVI